MTEAQSPFRVLRRGLGLSAVGLVGLGVVYVVALGYTPVEARQGLAQKIFYLPRGARCWPFPWSGCRASCTSGCMTPGWTALPLRQPKSEWRSAWSC